ncbi:hypothetical protein WJX74_006618 [Apatococcus lobatus]|uniref:Uncharacterized protein n=1 Tax=Apatococcus lobatus TaxID=904363 RepID=A0AAW1RC35_9CHLO
MRRPSSTRLQRQLVSGAHEGSSSPAPSLHSGLNGQPPRKSKPLDYTPRFTAASANRLSQPKAAYSSSPASNASSVTPFPAGVLRNHSYKPSAPKPWPSPPAGKMANRPVLRSTSSISAAASSSSPQGLRQGSPEKSASPASGRNRYRDSSNSCSSISMQSDAKPLPAEHARFMPGHRDSSPQSTLTFMQSLKAMRAVNDDVDDDLIRQTPCMSTEATAVTSTDAGSWKAADIAAGVIAPACSSGPFGNESPAQVDIQACMGSGQPTDVTPAALAQPQVPEAAEVKPSWQMVSGLPQVLAKQDDNQTQPVAHGASSGMGQYGVQSWANGPCSSFGAEPAMPHQHTRMAAVMDAPCTMSLSSSMHQHGRQVGASGPCNSPRADPVVGHRKVAMAAVSQPGAPCAVSGVHQQGSQAQAGGPGDLSNAELVMPHQSTEEAAMPQSDDHCKMQLEAPLEDLLGPPRAQGQQAIAACCLSETASDNDLAWQSSSPDPPGLLEAHAEAHALQGNIVQPSQLPASQHQQDGHSPCRPGTADSAQGEYGSDRNHSRPRGTTQDSDAAPGLCNEPTELRSAAGHASWQSCCQVRRTGAELAGQSPGVDDGMSKEPKEPDGEWICNVQAQSMVFGRQGPASGLHAAFHANDLYGIMDSLSTIPLEHASDGLSVPPATANKVTSTETNVLASSPAASHAGAETSSAQLQQPAAAQETPSDADHVCAPASLAASLAAALAADASFSSRKPKLEGTNHGSQAENLAEERCHHAAPVQSVLRAGRISGSDASDAQCADGQPCATPTAPQAPCIQEAQPFPGFPDPHTPHFLPAPISPETPRLAPISLATPVAPAELITAVTPMTDCGLDYSADPSAAGNVRPGQFVINQQSLAHALKSATLHIPACMELCIRSSPPRNDYGGCKVQLAGFQHSGGEERDVLALDGVGLKLRQLGASHAMRVSLATAAALHLTGAAETLVPAACHDDSEMAIQQPCVPGSQVADHSLFTRERQHQSGGSSQPHGHSSSLDAVAHQEDLAQQAPAIPMGAQPHLAQRQHASDCSIPAADTSSGVACSSIGSHLKASGSGPLTGSGSRTMQELSSPSNVSSFASRSSGLLPGDQSSARWVPEGQQRMDPAVLMSTFGWESDDSSLDMDLPEDFREEEEEEGHATRRDFVDDFLATNASLQDWTGAASFLDTTVNPAENASPRQNDRSGLQLPEPGQQAPCNIPSGQAVNGGKGLYSLLQEHQAEEFHAQSQQGHAPPPSMTNGDPQQVLEHAHGGVQQQNDDQQQLQALQHEEHCSEHMPTLMVAVETAPVRAGDSETTQDMEVAKLYHTSSRTLAASEMQPGGSTGRKHRRRSPSPEQVSCNEGLETIHEYDHGTPQPPADLIGSFTDANAGTFGAEGLSRWSAEYPPSLTVTASELPVSFADESSSPSALQYGRMSANSVRDSIRDEQSKGSSHLDDSQQTPFDSIGVQMPRLKPIRGRPPPKPAAKGVLSSMFMGCVGGKMPED